MTVKTASAAQTKKFGAQLAKKLSPGVVVCLYGDLGAGKTTLVQGIARGLGIKRRLVSPTFILARRYEIVGKRHETKDKEMEKRSKEFLWHVDLYRLEDISEAKTIGIEELIADQSNMLLIEWPEKIEGILPEKYAKIKIKVTGGEEREISYETLH